MSPNKLSRRNFLTLVVGAIASCTFLPDSTLEPNLAFEDALEQYSGDKIATVVKMVREATADNMFSWTIEGDLKLGRADFSGSLQYVLDNFGSDVALNNKIIAQMSRALKLKKDPALPEAVDFMSEEALEIFVENLVPIVVLRYFGARFRPLDTNRQESEKLWRNGIERYRKIIETIWEANGEWNVSSRTDNELGPFIIREPLSSLYWCNSPKIGFWTRNINLAKTWSESATPLAITKFWSKVHHDEPYEKDGVMHNPTALGGICPKFAVVINLKYEQERLANIVYDLTGSISKIWKSRLTDVFVPDQSDESEKVLSLFEGLIEPNDIIYYYDFHAGKGFVLMRGDKLVAKRFPQ